jgi:predicted lactoylglutathione lyase
MLVEEDKADAQQIAKGCSIFSTKSLSEDSKASVSRLLEHAAAAGGTAQLAAALNNGKAS